MNFLPISAIILRHLRLIFNYSSRLLFIFYWPVLDILVWGFFGNWLQITQHNNMEMILLLSILLWSSFARIGNEIFISLLEEIWSHNVINIFASPIKLSQWIIGVLLFVGLIFILLMSFLITIISLIYNISIISLIKNFLIFAPTLLLSAISLGFLALSIIIYFGIRFNEAAWILMWFFMPFSGVFYPVESLPTWAQKISVFLPMTYTFQGMREYVTNFANPIPYLIKSAVLSLVYGIVFLSLFFYAFKKSKDKGLSRLSD